MAIRFRVWVATAVLLLAIVSTAQAKYSGGSGTAQDPYQIGTAADLILLGETPADYDKRFLLTADIDLDSKLPGRKVFDKAVIAADTDPKKDGFQGTSFTGIFDGNGHTISHLTIHGASYLGLFGQLGWWDVPACEIKNLGVVDVSITGSGGGAGGLVGSNMGIVTECYSTGVVSGNGWGVGGLVASNDGGIVIRCHSMSTVSGTEQDSYVGGLVGYNCGSVTQCYSTGAVNGTGQYCCVGGLVGCNEGGAVVTQCYSTGRVTGGYYVGGLVGDNGGGMIDAWGTVTQCYSSSAVSGTGKWVGGLVGGGGEVTLSFWDTQTSGQGKSSGGIGKTTAQMQDPNLFRAAGWDFVGPADGPHDIWAEPHGRGYPILWWQLSPSPSLPTFSGGTGDPNDPYRILTVKDLNSIGYNPRLMKCHFKLVADLDLTGLHLYPIGNADCPYRGVFDGNDHTLSHLTIQGESDLGLFSRLESRAEVKDLGVVDVNITGSGRFVGGLAGSNGGMVTRCYSTGVVSGISDVGGLAGSNGGSVTQCFSSGSIRASGVSSPYGYVSWAAAGGLIGSNNRGATVTQCYSTGTVNGTGRDVGGLVGNNDQGTVTQCYSTGAVRGTQYVGGLVGNNSAGTVMRCYSTGAVSGGGYVGGLMGWDWGVVLQCVWDTDMSGLVSSAGGVGLTTAKMMDPHELGLNGFANDPNWVLEAGRDYPRLAWQGTRGHMIPEPNINWLEGHGTPEDPYRVSTAEQLIGLGRVSFLWDKHVVLGADINLDPKLPGGEVLAQAVIPLFAGVFDGREHTVSHLTIKGGSYVGLFGRLACGAEVRDLGVAAVSTTGSGSYVAGLVAFNLGGTVTQCYSTGAVSGSREVGGLVGYISSGSVTQCYSTSAVSGKDGVGGLVGDNYGFVTQCYSTGAVSGEGKVGGLVGYNYGRVADCYSTGAVASTDWQVGGLVGYNYGFVTRCYSTGAVTGTSYVGGLVGFNVGGGGTMANCYSIGAVNGTGKNVGGLVGGNDGWVTNCFWDSQTSGQAKSDGGTGKTTGQMQTAKTFLDAGWDFIGETKNGTEDIWWILEGKDYPHLWWELTEKKSAVTAGE